jgi:hypothetical protein
MGTSTVRIRLVRRIVSVTVVLFVLAIAAGLIFQAVVRANGLTVTRNWAIVVQ